MHTTLVINEVVKGLNGKGGLMCTHWATLAKRKKKYQLLFMSQTRNRHEGKVEVRMTRFTSKFMDEVDNLPSTAKLLMDAAVKAGIIKDDSPEYIVIPDGWPKQVKCKRIEQRTELLITDI